MDKLKRGIQLYAVSKHLTRVYNIAYAKKILRSGGAPVSLPFSMQRQLQTNWCWAATATSISLFYNGTSVWTQCSVASQTLGQSCCSAPFPTPCNTAYYLDDALLTTGNFVSYTNMVPFNQVEAELKKGRIVACRIEWGGGRGHFIAICGCSTMAGVNYFDVDDPDAGQSTISEAGLLSAYAGSGSWSHTFITKP
ncbi:MAG: papain-like cysteine protease family protein [Chitinophagaceae bacterium]